MTKISERVKKLQSSIASVVGSKERLPQPLFWSLLHAELDSIKRSRRVKRERLTKEFGIDWM